MNIGVAFEMMENPEKRKECTEYLAKVTTDDALKILHQMDQGLFSFQETQDVEGNKRWVYRPVQQVKYLFDAQDLKGIPEFLHNGYVLYHVIHCAKELIDGLAFADKVAKEVVYHPHFSRKYEIHYEVEQSEAEAGFKTEIFYILCLKPEDKKEEA